MRKDDKNFDFYQRLLARDQECIRLRRANNIKAIGIRMFTVKRMNDELEFHSSLKLTQVLERRPGGGDAL